MIYKIGDKVSVLDDVISGVVIELKGDKIVIEGNDGFPFEYYSNEIVLVKEKQSELSKYSDISNEDLEQKINETTPKKKSQFKSDLKPDKQPPMEVDLHIHQLTDSMRGLDKYDMLNIQIEAAKFKLEFAIKNRISKVVFIHGVGAGVLKTELDYLFKNYHVNAYAASFKKYGLGATEVYIYQNPKN